jgi:hypothetical protein
LIKLAGVETQAEFTAAKKFLKIKANLGVPGLTKAKALSDVLLYTLWFNSFRRETYTKLWKMNTKSVTLVAKFHQT